MMGGPTEPNADLRQLASTLWQTYIALTQEGFSESQALKIISELITSGMKGSD